MKLIFEEYGKVILAVLVCALLVTLIFGGIQVYKVIGEKMNIETTLNHSNSEQSVKEVSKRTAPVISVPDPTKLHLYADRVFNPISSVSCVDNEGTAIAVKVSRIVFIDADGSKTDVTESYKATDDTFNIATAVNKTGVLAVTYQAVDSYNVKTIKTISYVVDAVDN